MRLRAWLWILVLAVLAGLGGQRLARGGALQTDLLAMLPETEQNAVAERGVRVLSQATGDRAIFLVGGPGATLAPGRHFAQSLTASGAFASVLGTLPPVDPTLIFRFYAEHRFRLPHPSPGATVAAVRAAVETRLTAPMGSALGPEADPLGHVARFMDGLPLNSLRLEIQEGMLTLRSGDALYVLVTANLKGSAYDPAVQRVSLAAVRAAETALRAAEPRAELLRARPEVLRTGALFYAADARESAEWETGIIGWGSLAAIVALFLAVFRSARHLLLGLACVGAGLIAATAVTLLVFGKIYLLTLVCGSSMLGVAVDYPLLYFANQLGAGPAWNPRAALARLMPALLLGVVTTLLGYACLGVAPFPGLRQMAVFSMAGLAASFLTVLLVLPDALGRPLPERPRLMAALDRAGLAWLALGRRPAFRVALVLATLLAAAALLRLRVDDDVKSLIQPSGTLRTQEARIRELTGFSNSGRFFLVEGADEGAVLAREEALRARLEPLLRLGALEAVQAVSAFVPSPARQEEALRASRAEAPLLAQALTQVGFRPGAVARQGEELAAQRPLTVAAFLKTPFAGPFRMFWLGATVHGCGAMVYPVGACPSAQLREAAAGLPGVALVDKAQSVSGLLGHYRGLANGALALACVLVWLMLLWRYGLRSGTAILLPSLLGILAALAGLALVGSPLTLFNTIALVLVLGFGVDYAVFLAEGGRQSAPALLGVLLASFATLLSYGLLAFSHTPALRGFGLTLGLGVLAATLLAPFVPAPKAQP